MKKIKNILRGLTVTGIVLILVIGVVIGHFI
jgi:hypothetical protein